MIYDITPVNVYQGNDTSVHFDFDFYVENANQLNVFYQNSSGNIVKLVCDVDYTINELKNPNGSYIVFPIQGSEFDILSPNEKIILELTLAISQETQYNNSSLLNLESLEYSFDYLTRICQIQQRQLDRSVKVQEGLNIETDTLVENINKTASIADDISVLAQIPSDITAVKNNAANISSVASDLANIDSASSNAALSKDWAVKMDGAVDGIDFSAKYYAHQAAQAQIQANWNETNTNSKAYIQNKPSNLSQFTDNLGSSPVHSHSRYLDKLRTVGVLSTSGTVALEDNTENSVTPTGNITFSLPAITDNTKFHQILVQINLSTIYTITLGTSYYFNKNAPDLSTAGAYNLYYEYDKNNQYWVCGLLPKGAD